MLIQNDKSMRSTLCTNFERYMNGEITEKQFRATIAQVNAYVKMTVSQNQKALTECRVVETNKKYGSDIVINDLDTKKSN